MKPPRYFDKLYEKEFPKKFEAIKKARKETLDTIGYSITDPKYKRLREIEEVKQLKLKETIREIDN
jgi:1-acyl-sn-glycerol-3-phosphate acyltransferase